MNTKNSQITFTQNPQTLTFYHICVITLPSLYLPFASNTIFSEPLESQFQTWCPFNASTSGYTVSKDKDILLHRDRQMAHW